MTKLYADFIEGTITTNPLFIGETTIASAVFGSLPVVATPDTLRLVLDPERENGEPEIVIVTAHTAAATAVTVTRAADGTTAREHLVSTKVVCSWVTSDVEDIQQGIASLSGAGPLGVLGYAQVTADQGPISTETDLTSLTATVTVAASRYIRISAHAGFAISSALSTAALRIKEDTTQLQQGNAWNGGDTVGVSASLAPTTSPSVILVAPSAGSHTYKLTLESPAVGTVTLEGSATRPAYILVEDLGPTP